MPAFNDASNKTRQRVRVCGRGMFCTDSYSVEFVSEYGREAFPLTGQGWSRGALLDYNQVWVFPYELDGYLLIDSSARFNNLNTGPYEKHWVPANNSLVQVTMFKPFEPTISGIYLGPSVGDVPGMCAQLSIGVVNASNQETITLYNALRPYPVPEINALFVQGALAQDSYFGWSPLNPAYQWPATIQHADFVLSSLDHAGNTVYGGIAVDIVQPDGTTKPVTFLSASPQLGGYFYPDLFQRYALYKGVNGYPGVTAQ